MELIVNDQSVFAHTGGRPFDPSLPAVVLIHGAGMDHTVWNLQSRYLAHHGRSVLAVDLPGHGRSGGPPLTSIGEMANWVVALLEAVGVSRAALVGHSMGALVALEAAALYPDRVEALALLGVAEKMPVHPDLLKAAFDNDPQAIELVTGWGFGPRGHVGGNAAPGLALVPTSRRLMGRQKPGVLGIDLAACNAYTRGPEAAMQVVCPALFLLGALDRMTPAKAGRALAARVKTSQVIVLPVIGHMVMVEAPDPTIDVLAEIFRI
ncbi:MAG TPA: alpha/beta hydrolase [Azospirillum sp.]|nr:alpha/beta hydrolase [Azospirillum sp.]